MFIIHIPHLQPPGVIPWVKTRHEEERAKGKAELRQTFASHDEDVREEERAKVKAELRQTFQRVSWVENS